jgi:hypothetical protein
MKLNFILVTLFTINLCSSQNHIVIDTITKQPIAYVAITLGNNDGLYSNEKGEFYLKEESKDSISIISLGYYNFKQSISKLRDTIYLIPKVEKLDEIVINTKKNKLKLIGLSKKGGVLGWQLLPKNEIIAFLIPNKNYENAFLEKIYIPIKKSLVYNSIKKLKKKNEKYIGVLRINIYDIEDELPKTKIFSSLPIKFSMKNKNEIILDISDELIQFSKNGIGIGIEMIGRINSNGVIEYDNHAQLMPQFSNKTTKDFVITTYHKSVFYKELFPANDYINLPKEYNLSIGFTVSGYDH